LFSVSTPLSLASLFSWENLWLEGALIIILGLSQCLLSVFVVFNC
jgi:hypothetical protein